LREDAPDELQPRLSDERGHPEVFVTLTVPERRRLAYRSPPAARAGLYDAALATCLCGVTSSCT